MGNEIVEHSEEAKKMAQARHQIGNHTYINKKIPSL